MSGNDFGEFDSDFALKKLARMSEGVDRISKLPDDIIVHILSFLPLKKAGATSLLSKRWLDLWKYTPKLNFVDYKGYRVQIELPTGNYARYVNSVLNSHKALSLQEFTIAFLVKRSNQYEVTKWLEFALSRRVEKMELNYEFLRLKKEDYVVPEEILNAVTTQTSNYLSLKVLCFRNFNMSGCVVELFLRNCLFLEQLVLDELIMTSDLEVASGSLKLLDIRSRDNKMSIDISAPNLTCLTIDHDSSRVSLKNVPKLVNIHIFFRLGDTMHAFGEVAAQLETLIISLYDLTESFWAPEMPILKKLVVYYHYVDPGIRIPITWFMRASPCLEELKLEISEFPVDEAIFEIPKGCPMLSLRHLKLFVLSGFCGGCCDRIELVKYIVDNCVALEEIVIGQCDLIDLVRNLVNYCVPLDEILFPNPHDHYVVTREDRVALEETVRLLKIPAHIRLRIVGVTCPQDNETSLAS